MNSKKKWIVAGGACLALWLLTQLIGAPMARVAALAAEKERVGEAYADPQMKGLALAPFVVKVDKLIPFRLQNTATGESKPLTVQTTSLYLWIGVSIRLTDGLWEKVR